MVGGIFTSFIMELGVYPAIYAIWKWNFGLKKQLARAGGSRRSLDVTFSSIPPVKEG